MDGDRWLAVPTKVCQIVPLILPITPSPPLSRPKLLLNSSPTPARVHSFSNTTVHRCTAFAGCKVILFLLSTGALVVFQYLLAPASVGSVSCANAVCPPHLVPLLCGHRLLYYSLSSFDYYYKYFPSFSSHILHLVYWYKHC
jgi:hypothetical protein